MCIRDRMKTGFTKKSGKCLVSSAKKDGVTLVAVTLNGGDYWNDHIKLFDYGFSQVEAVQLEAPCLPDIAVTGGCTSRVQPRMEKPPAVTLLKGEKEKLVVRVELDAFEWAPVAAGQLLGSVRSVSYTHLALSVPLDALSTLFMKLFNFIFMVPSSLRFFY